MTGKELGQDAAFTSPSVYAEASEQLRDNGAIGLTKRELFAAMAMQGLLANVSTSASLVKMTQKSGRLMRDELADVAIEHADGLLDELAKDV